MDNVSSPSHRVLSSQEPLLSVNYLLSPDSPPEINLHGQVDDDLLLAKEFLPNIDWSSLVVPSVQPLLSRRGSTLSPQSSPTIEIVEQLVFGCVYGCRTYSIPVTDTSNDLDAVIFPSELLPPMSISNENTLATCLIVPSLEKQFQRGVLGVPLIHLVSLNTTAIVCEGCQTMPAKKTTSEYVATADQDTNKKDKVALAVQQWLE